MPVTPDGLWVGSDTDHAGNEFHQKIAFFPAEGGIAPPPVVTYTLPNDLYNMDQAGVGALNRRSYNLTTFGSTSTVPVGVDWRNARGAFMLNGNLYYGMNDGWLYKRTFDGTTLGAASQVALNGLEVQPPSGFNIPGTTTRIPAFALGTSSDLANMTGMFYDNGRIYYTVSKTGSASANNNKLYYRYFNPESEIVGANLFVASTGGEGVNWGNVRGMTLASGKLIYALNDGRLYSVNWGGTKPTGAVTQISSATTWQSRGMFVFNQVTDTFAPSKPGTPTGSSSTFDSIDISWGASTDNFGSSLTYRVYRDGVQIDQVASSSTGTVSYTDIGLPAGSIHTYQVDAVDAATNASVLSDVSGQITVLAPDMTPPGDPGIADRCQQLHVDHRSDLGRSGRQRQYGSDVPRVPRRAGCAAPDRAVHELRRHADVHRHRPVAGEQPHVLRGGGRRGRERGEPGCLRSDHGDRGGLRRRLLRRDCRTGTRSPGSPRTSRSARLQRPAPGGIPTNQTAFAYANLSTTLTAVCVSANVNVSNRTTALDLIRLRTAANGAVAKVYLDAQGRLIVRSDFASTQLSSGVILPTGWNRIEICGTGRHHVRYVGSLPQRLPDRERVGGEHRHDTGRADPDRRHRGQDMDGELRRRDRG